MLGSNNMINHTPARKCDCACHENKLGQPYEHDTKCCEKMNGSVVSTPESRLREAWRSEFDPILAGTDIPWQVRERMENWADSKLSQERETAYETGYEEGESSMFANFVGGADLDSAESVSDVIRQIAQGERERLVRIVEELIDQNDDGMWSGRETADHILALLKSKN